MYDIISFYLGNLFKIFYVWTQWILVPGLNFLVFVLCIYIIQRFLSYFWKEKQESDVLSRKDRALGRRAKAEASSGKHAYVAKHERKR